VLQTLKDMDAGKEVNLETCVGLKEQLNEIRKNLNQEEDKQKQNEGALTRMERERIERKEVLDQITKQNEDIKS